MNIIPVINSFITGIFMTAEKFLENPVQFSELENSLSALGNKTLAGIMGQILDEADQFLQGEPGRSEKYTVQRHDTRMLITTFGDVSFTHTLYQAKDTRKYRFLLDERMHLPKDERFSELAEVKVLQEATKTSYQHAADQLQIGMQTVSKVAVMNKVHGIQRYLPEEEVTEQRKCKYLYIEADEDHINLQKAGEEDSRNCIIGKLVYVFEGKEETTGGRQKLINPAYFGGDYSGSEANAEMWEEVASYIRIIMTRVF